MTTSAERTIKPELAACIDAEKENTMVRTVITVREGADALVRREGRPAPVMARTVDAVIPGRAYDVPVRIFIPEEGRPLPVMVYYHGGGFAAGNVMLYERIGRRMAAAAQCIVAVPEYRLAPENRCPAAEEDALAAAQGVRALLTEKGIPHEDTLWVGGDSAGGTLAAFVSGAMQDTAAPAAQVLIYPWLDMTASYPSIEENCRGETGFPRAELDWYLRQYFRPEDDLRAHSPLFGRMMGRMPRTLLVTAEFCPFRDEDAAYLARLEAAGVSAARLHFPHMTHTFLKFETACAEEVRRTYEAVRGFLRQRDCPAFLTGPGQDGEIFLDISP